MPRTTSTVLVAIATAALGAAVLAPVAAQAATPYKATIKTSTTRTNVGSVITVSGKVTGGPVKGKKVTIYSFNGSKENAPTEKEKVVALTSKGTYSAKIRLRDGGYRLFRVIKSAEGGHAKGVGVADAIRVFRMAGGNEFASRKVDGTSVNGKTSRGGWEIWENNFVAFDLTDHDCISFDAHVGLDSDASAGSATGNFLETIFSAYGSVTVYQGRDAVRFSGPLASGSSVGVSSTTPEASKFDLTDIDFKCNTPYDF